MMTDDVTLERPAAQGHWTGRFTAMASPCEVLIDLDDEAECRRLARLAAAEAQRIERAWSRYRDDNIIHAINTSGGRPVTVDPETAQMLDLAARCHELSGGRFDVTSGALRRAWRFDGTDRIPAPDEVRALLPLVGWRRVRWEPPVLTLPTGMEIDLGGLGKEYAVDRAAELLGRETAAGVLVNFGGDLRASGPARSGAWEVGIEDPEGRGAGLRRLSVSRGGLATSGDARRFLLRDGIRYTHVLNPRTGWPVRQAPASVTVLADSCLEAGLLATLGLLHGREAEGFLREQRVRFWCWRRPDAA